MLNKATGPGASNIVVATPHGPIQQFTDQSKSLERKWKHEGVAPAHSRFQQQRPSKSSNLHSSTKVTNEGSSPAEEGVLDPVLHTVQQHWKLHEPAGEEGLHGPAGREWAAPSKASTLRRKKAAAEMSSRPRTNGELLAYFLHIK
ncbi:hypothetical protein LR48_Vigan272s004900 [Vigna angularis]|uniref:Uncharacterized protein n=1 Tax=Phaseolus angularis TaxID=3914 RepID=A0A0L9T800_PHAAN|nr:hypothetical protein LR48_Vigan272s004900 [Vigna angularis]